MTLLLAGHFIAHITADNYETGGGGGETDCYVQLLLWTYLNTLLSIVSSFKEGRTIWSAASAERLSMVSVKFKVIEL